MRKLQFILFFVLLSTLAIPAQTIYQTGFETGFDGWKSTMTLYRVGLTYGIHPVGSYMWDNSTAFSVLTRKLNLKSGRTYHFAFKYNNSLTGSLDTTFIGKDTILNRSSQVLGGTSKIHLTSSHAGISDANWHVVTFSVTPTANGGYWHLNCYDNSSEMLVDSLVVTGDTSSVVTRMRVRR